MLNPDNMTALKKNGIVGLLTASPEAIWARVSRNENRPLVREGGKEKVEAIMTERAPLYDKYADFRVDNTRMGPAKCADLIIALFTKLQKFS